MGHFASDLGFASEIFQQSANNMVLAEYYSLVKGPIGPLRGWMDREWHKNPERIRDSRAHKLITKLGFPIIYTTNYDRWIELAFEDPLDIKLRGDTLDRGVLFIGYSLSDINIRYLLFKLQEIWSAYGGTQ